MLLGAAIMLSTRVVPVSADLAFRQVANSTDPGCQTPACLNLSNACTDSADDIDKLLSCFCDPKFISDAETCFKSCKVAGAALAGTDLEAICDLFGPDDNSTSTAFPWPTETTTRVPSTTTASAATTPAPAAGVATSSPPLSTGAIVGIAIGGVAALALVGAGGFLLARKRGQPKDPEATPAVPAMASQPLPTTYAPPTGGVYPYEDFKIKYVGTSGSPMTPATPTSPALLLAPSVAIARSDSTTTGQISIMTAEPASHRDLTGAECTAIRTFVPERDDELLINSGDGIRIFEAFEDGWARGLNHLTRQEGVFPLAAVVRIAGPGGTPTTPTASLRE